MSTPFREKVMSEGQFSLYPGGNFASNFCWEDSVGPREQRKPRLDLALRTYEPNEAGINEFSKWAKKADTDIMMAVNLGTRGTSDALNLPEYCNLDTKSAYADLRRAYGDTDPYGITLWCMGNKMDGSWQFGHKSASEYGHLAAETSKGLCPIISGATGSRGRCGSSCGRSPEIAGQENRTSEGQSAPPAAAGRFLKGRGRQWNRSNLRRQAFGLRSGSMRTERRSSWTHPHRLPRGKEKRICRSFRGMEQGTGAPPEHTSSCRSR